MHEKAPGYQSNSPVPSRSEAEEASPSTIPTGTDPHHEPPSNAREHVEVLEMEKKATENAQS